ncbi:hypothetical protein HK105_205591 [Polyrhizophydium stewartii]|uniref:Cyclin N-terminal domain-containing protein n=1 Tax=Polyrhizophydium stewartii TaxID=2732419 RepID=A0ABR4N5U7_9FUNG
MGKAARLGTVDKRGAGAGGAGNEAAARMLRIFEAFCARVIEQTQAHPSLVFAALLYVRRLGERNPLLDRRSGPAERCAACAAAAGGSCGSSIAAAGVRITDLHLRLFALAMMAAAKMYEDRWSAVEGAFKWARLLCIDSDEELAVLERGFLAGIDYDLVVRGDELRTFLGDARALLAEGGAGGAGGGAAACMARRERQRVLGETVDAALAWW